MGPGHLRDEAGLLLNRLEFGARSGEHQHRLVVRESAVQDGLEDVVDHAPMVLNDWPDVDPEGGPARPNILFLFFPEMVGQRALQTGGRRHQHQSVDMEPAVAENHRSGCFVPLVDR
jgi:hypothetical protein